MTHTAGIDIGSTYTKAIVLNKDCEIVGKAILPTGFRLAEVALQGILEALEVANLQDSDLEYIVATGFGRHQAPNVNITATDLTASARGCTFLFPNTRTVLDIGGQTMKASLLDNEARVRSFRLNDKCAAGTGAFLEKTAYYMGFTTAEIGPLTAISKEPVPISGVCAVFAESEVINHLSQGHAPSDIMHGAILSLVDRSIQLMRRVKMQPEYTLIGGILGLEIMGRVLREQIRADVNIPLVDIVQFVPALGAALLAQQRVQLLKEGKPDKQVTR